MLEKKIYTPSGGDSVDCPNCYMGYELHNVEFENITMIVCKKCFYVYDTTHTCEENGCTSSSFYFDRVTKYSINGIQYEGNPDVSAIEFTRNEEYYKDEHEMKHIKIIETICSCDGEIHGPDASYPYSEDENKIYYSTDCPIITKHD
jgi:hypothetical protein